MTQAATGDTVGLAVAGLGVAGAAMLPAIDRHPRVRLVAVADLNQQRVEEVASRFGAQGHASVESLCERPDIDAVYLATPTAYHLEQTLAAASAGKHVVVEKPMGFDLEQATAMVTAADRAGVHVIVGHSQSFEAPARKMAEIVRSGELGPLLMLHNWYYTDWLYRPRTPDEFDSTKAGGVTFRQGAHQVDILRLIAGGMTSRVRAMTTRADPARPTEGSHVAYLEFDDGVAATAVYSGYDHFSSTELTFGVGEGGDKADPTAYAASRHRLAALTAEEEAALKRSSDPRALRQSEVIKPGRYQPFFGLTIVSCAHGDLRGSPQGLYVYGDDQRREISLVGAPGGRTALLDELCDAVLSGRSPTHDARWGRANLEVCAAIVESARRREEIELRYQVAVPERPD